MFGLGKRACEDKGVDEEGTGDREDLEREEARYEGDLGGYEGHPPYSEFAFRLFLVIAYPVTSISPPPLLSLSPVISRYHPLAHAPDTMLTTLDFPGYLPPAHP